MNTEVICIFREEREGPAGLEKVKKNTKTTFTLALDRDKKSSKAYSPKRMTFDNYVINKDGSVKAIIAGTLTDRATAEELLKQLKEIESQ